MSNLYIEELSPPSYRESIVTPYYISEKHIGKYKQQNQKDIGKYKQQNQKDIDTRYYIAYPVKGFANNRYISMWYWCCPL